MTDFAVWLAGELAARGWSEAELARRGGVSAICLISPGKACHPWLCWPSG